MRHWYVYHSAEKMGRRYGHPTLNRVFTTGRKNDLCSGDRIWVVEGVGESPKRFSLAASFVCDQTHLAPFPSGLFGDEVSSKFVCAYSGPGQSFGDKVRLDKDAQPWFSTLHGLYITKQRFFADITNDREMVDGLKSLVA